MILAFDLGNSRWKWAPIRNGLLEAGCSREYGDDFARTLDGEFSNQPPPDRAVAVSVTTGQHTEILARWLKVRWGVALERFTAGNRVSGLANSYREPERLGADRWAALVAARHRVRHAVCVVDAGTAVTIDALDAENVFRGGVILPGLGLQRAALLRGTAGVGSAVGDSGDALACTTADAVASGTLLGLAGAIDRLIDEQSKRLGSSLAVLLTGGDAVYLKPHLKHPASVVPDLVLEGVARMVAES